ncbi:MAG: hypothetical protein IJX46_08745 [Clostridia bacterium]|nr:hypothetical protein [Clostridia bacterium]
MNLLTQLGTNIYDDGIIAWGILIACVLVVLMVINAVVASHMELIAVEKGYDKKAHAFWMCFWFGPIGWIYVAMLPDKVRRTQQKVQNEAILLIVETMSKKNDQN